MYDYEAQSWIVVLLSVINHGCERPIDYTNHIRVLHQLWQVRNDLEPDMRRDAAELAQGIAYEVNRAMDSFLREIAGPELPDITVSKNN